MNVFISSLYRSLISIKPALRRLHEILRKKFNYALSQSNITSNLGDGRMQFHVGNETRPTANKWRNAINIYNCNFKPFTGRELKKRKDNFQIIYTPNNRSFVRTNIF
jgi:hypothetical protein